MTGHPAVAVAPAVTGDELEAARAVMEVDLEAVTHNLAAIEELAGGEARTIAVVKGDGYGMGAAVVARHLVTLGVRQLATDNAAEAARIRAAGVRVPILVLYGEPPEHAGAYLDHDLTPVVHDVCQAVACADACAPRDAELGVWLGTNLGFNRAGAREAAGFSELLETVAACAAHLRVLGVLGHLTASHRAGGPTADEIATFGKRLVAARDRFGASVQSSLFASHGIPRWSVTHPTNWVRPGIALAGEHCFTDEVLRTDPGAFELAQLLRPAVRIRARLIHVLAITRTEGVGYGTQPSVTLGRRLACATIGFRSGFPEGDETTPAIYRGQLVARAGALGMDSLQLDVTDVDGAEAGDWVTLAGRDGRQEVRLAAIWRTAGLTPYQLLARLRLPRTYPTTTIHHHEEER